MASEQTAPAEPWWAEHVTPAALNVYDHSPHMAHERHVRAFVAAIRDRDATNKALAAELASQIQQTRDWMEAAGREQALRVSAEGALKAAREALDCLASGSFAGASVLAVEGRWRRFVEEMQNYARAALTKES